MNVDIFGDWALAPEPPVLVSSPTPEGLAAAAVVAGLVPAEHRHAIEHAALGAAAEFVARGVDVSRYTFHAGAGGAPSVVQILFAPPFEDDRAKLAAMLGDTMPPGLLDGLSFGPGETIDR